MTTMLLRRHWIVSIAALAWAMGTGCSSSVSVTATRFSGIVFDRSMAMEVAPIAGNDAPRFEEELKDAIASTKMFNGAPPANTPESSGRMQTASLLVRGTYNPQMKESITDKFENNEWQRYREKTYVASFNYNIVDKLSGEFVIDGYLEESGTELEKDEELSFLQSIIWESLKGFFEDLFGIDYYKTLRKKIVRRFIDELSPRESQVEVILFQDDDMPELDHGIGFARVHKWKEAAEVFKAAIDKYPTAENLDKAYYNLGVAYEYDFQFKLAEECFEKAIMMEDDDVYHEELQECRRFAQQHGWRQRYLERLNAMP